MQTCVFFKKKLLLYCVFYMYVIFKILNTILFYVLILYKFYYKIWNVVKELSCFYSAFIFVIFFIMDD